MRYSLLPAFIAFFGITVAEEPPAGVIAKPDALKTLVNPDCSHCKDEAKRRAADLREDDRVLGWIRGKYNGGAIPLRFYLSPYRVISDTYGVFVYDADAGFVRGFEPSLDFTFHGWRNGVMLIHHKDGTVYSALSGQGVEGPNKGKRLKIIPTLESNWGFWLKAYPDTVAYKMYPKYQAVDLPTALNDDSVKSRARADTRFAADTQVLGIRLGSKTRAYPLNALEKSGGILTDEVDGQKLVVFWFAPTRTAAAYLAEPPKDDSGKTGSPLGFHFDAGNAIAPFVDEATSSHWDVAGRAVDGALKGKTLTWVDSVHVKWFAWSAEYPETDAYASRLQLR
jgi:hypothetical protein